MKLRWLFYKYFIISLSVSFIIMFLFLDISRLRGLNELKKSSKLQLNNQKEQILYNFNSIKSDLLFLPELNEMLRYKRTKDPVDLALISKEFFEFSKSKQIYDQIRYIDEEGLEAVRVNYNNGNPVIVDKDQLQNKKDRYYFTETSKIKENSIYISPFDLNIENGKIETPLKPMIRFSTPVFSIDGEFKGIIIINYLAQQLLDTLKNASESELGKYSLVNSSSFWLFNYMKPELEWGFHFPEKANYNMKIINKNLWQEINSLPENQIITDSIIMTSLVIDPFVESNYMPVEKWILISQVFLEDSDILWKNILFNRLPLIFILLIFNAIMAFIISEIITQKKILTAKLEHSALHDSLTELPNRRFLWDRLNYTLEHTKRYDFTFAVLYIDLDGFKKVNDSLGHQSGDLLLKTCAERLTRNVRATDTVARVGGDEFVILVSRIETPENCKYIAEKILTALSTPIKINKNEVTIGASIGIALYNKEKNQSAEDLISMADSAMYRIKESGKNGYHFAS